MITFAESIASKEQALRRGDVIGSSIPLIPGESVNCVYAAIPVVFGEDFATYEESTPPTVMVWHLPLQENEAKFVEQNGWSMFEDILVAEKP